MYIEGFEQWFKLNKNLTTPLSDWNKAATESCRRIAQKNLEIAEENFSLWSDQIKRFSSIRRPEDFVNLQKDCLNENINAAIKNIQELVQLSMKNMEEFSKLYGPLHEQILARPLKAEKAREREREKEREK